MTSGIKLVIMAPDTNHNRKVFKTIADNLKIMEVENIAYGPILQIENVNVLMHWDGRKQKEKGIHD